jgi:hypothetical protein
MGHWLQNWQASMRIDKANIRTQKQQFTWTNHEEDTHQQPHGGSRMK